MLLVKARRLDIAPNTDQFWTMVSRINGPEFSGVLHRAREAIFDSAGISFTIDLLNKFLQFDVTKSWSTADEGELFMGQAPVVGWLRGRLFASPSSGLRHFARAALGRRAFHGARARRQAGLHRSRRRLPCRNREGPDRLPQAGSDGSPGSPRPGSRHPLLVAGARSRRQPQFRGDP